MYYPNHIEAICYEDDHVSQVVEEIEANFSHYFNLYLETEDGQKILEKDFEELVKKFGCTKKGKPTKKIDKSKAYKSIVRQAISDFEKDRASYLEILDVESLEEHEEDPSNFKNSVLKNECPIIRLALQNKKAKELDKYRVEFRRADPNELLEVVTNLATFADDYFENVYNEETYENMQELKEIGFEELDGEDYTVYGVIGGGIKSHLLYKSNPTIFPNRSRAAIWAFWYLTNKKSFECDQDSEFLMINLDKNTTQQNYFYPYELFSFYAFNIYKMLKEEAQKLDVVLDDEYRYIFVNSFLSFVAKVHSEEINFLKSEFTEDSYGYQ